MLANETSCIGCKLFKDGATLRHECLMDLARAWELEPFFYRCTRCGYEGYWRPGDWPKCAACHSTRIGKRAKVGESKAERHLPYLCTRCGYEGYWRTGNWLKCAACHSTRIGWLEW